MGYAQGCVRATCSDLDRRRTAAAVPGSELGVGRSIALRSNVPQDTSFRFELRREKKEGSAIKAPRHAWHSTGTVEVSSRRLAVNSGQSRPPASTEGPRGYPGERSPASVELSCEVQRLVILLWRHAACAPVDFAEERPAAARSRVSGERGGGSSYTGAQRLQMRRRHPATLR